jgi:hypothetical protein
MKAEGEPRKLPAVDVRMETGAIQFGDDWPGLFIRGDNCLGIMSMLAIPAFRQKAVASLFELLKTPILRGLADALKLPENTEAAAVGSNSATDRERRLWECLDKAEWAPNIESFRAIVRALRNELPSPPTPAKSSE